MGLIVRGFVFAGLLTLYLLLVSVAFVAGHDLDSKGEAR